LGCRNHHETPTCNAPGYCLRTCLPLSGKPVAQKHDSRWAFPLCRSRYQLGNVVSTATTWQFIRNNPAIPAELLGRVSRKPCAEAAARRPRPLRFVNYQTFGHKSETALACLLRCRNTPSAAPTVNHVKCSAFGGLPWTCSMDHARAQVGDLEVLEGKVIPFGTDGIEIVAMRPAHFTHTSAAVTAAEDDRSTPGERGALFPC